MMLKLREKSIVSAINTGFFCISLKFKSLLKNEFKTFGRSSSFKPKIYRKLLALTGNSTICSANSLSLKFCGNTLQWLN